MKSDSNLLIINGLTVEFGENSHLVTAVKELDLTIKESEILGIVGESGSGKTVTGLSIMGLAEREGANITHGSIVYTAENPHVDLRSLSDQEWTQFRGTKMAMIFQDPKMALNPTQKIGTQLKECIAIHQKEKILVQDESIYTLLKQVELTDHDRILNSFPHQLSGGQLQRVMIAMALSNNPKILIADEPTTALDATVQKKIVELLKDLNRKLKLSILFISHDLALISEIADRVVVMKKGVIVEQGDTQRVFSNPQHPYTRSLIASRPRMDVKLAYIPVFQEGEDSSSIDAESHFISAQQITNRQKELQNQRPLLSASKLDSVYPSAFNFFGVPKAFVKAVDKVDLEIRSGEIVGLVGESGSGKSTLAHTLIRLKEAASGTILYNGEELSSFEGSKLKDYRKDVQLIFQNPYSSLNPRIRIGDAIMEGLKSYRLHKTKEKERVLQLLKEVGLESIHFDRFPNQLSGGQRQRASIAKVLAVEPKIIICDECVSSLDVTIQAKILNLLLNLKDKYQLSLLFISHDLAVVKFISDSILVMQNGKIVERGWAEDIYQNPKTEYTKELIAAIPGYS